MTLSLSHSIHHLIYASQDPQAMLMVHGNNKIICWMGFCVFAFYAVREIKFQTPTTFLDANWIKNCKQGASESFSIRSLSSVYEKAIFMEICEWGRRQRRRKQIKITQIINLCDQCPASEIIMSMTLSQFLKYISIKHHIRIGHFKNYSVCVWQIIVTIVCVWVKPTQEYLCKLPSRWKKF